MKSLVRIAINREITVEASKLMRTALRALAMVILTRGAAAQVISYGQTLVGAVNCGQTLTYSFVAAAGDRVVVHVVETVDYGGVCVGACFCFDQCVDVRFGGTTVGGVACTPIQGNALNQYRTIIGPLLLPAAGVYNIVVRDADWNGRGQVAVTLQRTNGPAVPYANLAPPATVVVPLSAAGRVETFTFAGLQGSVVQATTTSLSGGIVPVMDLYDSSGLLVTAPSIGTLNATLSSSGPYTLLCFSGGGAVTATGTYQLSLTSTAPPIDIFPASGRVAAGVTFDLGVILRMTGLGVTSGSFVLDGVNITNALLASCQSATLTSGGLAIRCPGVSAVALGLGSHSFSVTLVGNGGLVSTKSVAWEVLP